MQRKLIGGVLVAISSAGIVAPGGAGAQRPEPIVSVEVEAFSGQYATGEQPRETGASERERPGKPPTKPTRTEDTDGERTQKGYVGVYREGVVACNGNPDRFPSPSETLGVGPYTMQGYIWVGPELASSNQTFGSQAGNVAGAGNNHRTNATATGQPTGESPCPEEDPDAIND